MIKLIAVGDIFLKSKNDEDPFEDLKLISDHKNILFGNLEVVLSKTGSKTEKFAVLYSNPLKVDLLKNANFDVLNLANNHILDRGLEGLINTIDILKKNGLNYIGITEDTEENYLILKTNGFKIGFLGYTVSPNNTNRKIYLNVFNEEKILYDLRVLKRNSDFVVISLHWGIENVFYPSPEQIKFARKLIDNGASVILGHHPHVIQGIEKYKNGLIAYSLGNFNFDYFLSKSKTNKSFILSVSLDNGGVIDFDISPVGIDENFIPKLLNGKSKYETLDFISKVSLPIVKNKITENWWFKEIAGEYLSSNGKSYFVRIKQYGLSHFLSFCLWLLSPFSFKCYMGLLRRLLANLGLIRDD